MDAYLPQSTILGNLKTVEIYEYYDQPRLFACKNSSGQIFISVWVDTEDIGDVWLYAPISSEKFIKLRNQEVDLRNIFTNSEDAFVFKVITCFQGNRNIVDVLPSEQISEDYLPEANQFIEARTRLEYEEIKKIASKKKREIVNLIVHPTGKYRNELPIDSLGTILKSVQETIYAIGQMKEGKSESSSVALEITEKTTLVTSKVFSGSFGIRIEGAFFEQDLFGESLVGRCIEELIGLINIGANPEALRAKLIVLKKKSASKYRGLLEAILISGVVKMNIEWASPTPGKGGVAEISLGVVEEVVRIINDTRLASKTILVVLVKVVMIHYRTGKITLEQLNPQKKFQCIITKEASKDVETISETTTYMARIQEYIILAPIVGKESHEYELLELRQHVETAPLIPM